MLKAIPIRQVLEIRYERGYRYLDHCGEVMLILQDLLPSETNSVWMPEETTPSGAKLKCPDRDIRLIFDTTKILLDQTISDDFSLFPAIAETIFGVISGRFDLRSIVRLGSRRFLTIGTDTVEAAEAQYLKLSPTPNWPSGRPERLLPKAGEVTSSFESEDGSEGFNFSLKPFAKIEAPEQLDERIRVPARLLESGQKEALVEQQKRKAQREKDPTAGVLIDIDYYNVRPVKIDVPLFWETATKVGNKLAEETFQITLARK